MKKNVFHLLPDTLSLHCPNTFKYRHCVDRFTALHHNMLTGFLFLLPLLDFCFTAAPRPSRSRTHRAVTVHQ